MSYFSLLSFFLLFSCASSEPGVPFGYSKQQSGLTKLLGTSFGLLGINATFDYVIIGGGTAGLTVANRLAANPNLSVAVIEGGSFYEINNGNLSQIPAFVADYSSADPADIQPLIDWGIVTVPQPQLDARVFAYTQGKCFGGSSARNYMAYLRGTAGCYQQWADHVGDESYTFTNLLPHFQKSVAFTPPNYAKRGPGSNISFDSAAFSASGGPLHVSYPNYYAPIAPYVKSSYEALGLNEIPGFSSGELLGFSEWPLTADPDSETRSSSEASFLQQSLASSPLTVYQQTLAKRILFDSNNRATGVNVVTAGKSYNLTATKEVILAAGAFRSPQLLMVSGVGPAATLQQFNISVISDLQGVGQNMWDQPFFGVVYEVNVTTTTQLAENATLFYEATQDFLQNQAGPLTSISSTYIGFEKLPQSYRADLSNTTLTDLSSFAADWPELELLPLAAGNVPSNNSLNQATFSVAIETTTSRGNVTINSTDTNDNPIVSTNWMLSQTDEELSIQAFRRIREVANISGITIGDELAPGPAVQTDAEILQYLREYAGGMNHASASCAMGKSGDPNAVVDSYGKVFGVNSLRVVDISSFPLLPPGHPQGTVYMIAEKRADDILNGR